MKSLYIITKDRGCIKYKDILYLLELVGLDNKKVNVFMGEFYSYTENVSSLINKGDIILCLVPIPEEKDTDLVIIKGKELSEFKKYISSPDTEKDMYQAVNKFKKTREI
jgi:hypothetical protein